VSLLTDPRRRRWLAWGVLVSAFLLVSCYRLSSAVLADRLMRAFDATGAELGTLHAAFFYVYALLQLPAGALADRYGPRRLATAGTAVMSLGTLAFALADGYVAAFVARSAMGLGAAVIYISILRFGVDWFRPNEFATLNGLTASVAGLGGVVATYPLAVAASALGWRDALLSLGGGGLLIAVGVFALVRDTPAEADLPPIRGVPDSPTLTLAEVRRNVTTVLRAPSTWLAGIALFVAIGVNTTLLGLWGIPYLVQVHDLTVTEASRYTLVGSVGIIVGSPAVGWLSDRFDSRTVLVLAGAAVYASLMLALTLAPALPPALFAVILFGNTFLSGAFILTYTVVKERHDTAASGVAVGAINTLGFLGAAVLPTLMGVALDAYWTGETVAGTRTYTLVGYRVAFALAAGAGLVALLCAVGLHRVSGANAG
jgi:sugar phosphate permease